MTTKTATKSMTKFYEQLLAYKNTIDDDIAQYIKDVQRSVSQQFGETARLETDAYLGILGHGGKRIRGALTMVGYEMSGGDDTSMIIQAARAIEMMHAYILIIDDIQDRSAMRRGTPAAHMQLAAAHKQHKWAGDSGHFGVSIALNAALSGAHAAQMILANLPADPELRLKAVSIMNRTMIITAHGQTGDIMNQVVSKVSMDNIEKVLEWKTAQYTFLNPLQVGMVLAGADCAETTAITDYAMHAGCAYQLSDDLLGVFGDEQNSGKNPFDDIREGKRTLMMLYALEHAADSDKEILREVLGSEHITGQQFKQCQSILQSSGAVDYTRNEVARHVRAAQTALRRGAKQWPRRNIDFLDGLVEYLLTRTN